MTTDAPAAPLPPNSPAALVPAAAQPGPDAARPPVLLLRDPHGDWRCVAGARRRRC